MKTLKLFNKNIKNCDKYLPGVSAFCSEPDALLFTLNVSISSSILLVVVEFTSEPIQE